MLVLNIQGDEYIDDKTQEFRRGKGWTIVLEHSLVSLAKWEAKWCKPFLTQAEKTAEEIIDYVKCMTLTQNVDPKAYEHLENEHFEQINAYINAPMTATWFSKEKKSGRNREQVTAELIYYWMIAHNIPFECQKWHLNRLMTLIKVCNIKGQPQKKMSKREIFARNTALNAARRKQLGTKG
jgi:hypothetical protein